MDKLFNIIQNRARQQHSTHHKKRVHGDGVNVNDCGKEGFRPLSADCENGRVDIWETSRPAKSMTQHDVKHGECPQAGETMYNVRRLGTANIKQLCTVFVNGKGGIKVARLICNNTKFNSTVNANSMKQRTVSTNHCKLVNCAR